jgi:hypothetical protein
MDGEEMPTMAFVSTMPRFRVRRGSGQEQVPEDVNIDDLSSDAATSEAQSESEFEMEPKSAHMSSALEPNEANEQQCDDDLDNEMKPRAHQSRFRQLRSSSWSPHLRSEESSDSDEMSVCDIESVEEASHAQEYSENNEESFIDGVVKMLSFYDTPAPEHETNVPEQETISEDESEDSDSNHEDSQEGFFGGFSRYFSSISATEEEFQDKVRVLRKQASSMRDPTEPSSYEEFLHSDVSRGSLKLD